jgi:uncharacterized membrane protein YGL010W
VKLKSLESYLDNFSKFHEHPTNILIHLWIIPSFLFSFLGILKALPVPVSWPMWLDWSIVILFLQFSFYLSLKNIRVLFALLTLIIPMILVLELLRPRFFIVSILILLLACFFQYLGNKIEGKAQRQFIDSLYLLIWGPVWTVNLFAGQAGIDLKIKN